MSERDMAAEKAQLREAFRAARRSIPETRRRSNALVLADSIAEMPELSGASLVLGYGATPEEIDPEPALVRLREQGVRVAYPRVAGSALELCEVAGVSECTVGAFGIREPCADAPRVDARDLDAVLVPAVAFDVRGYRLGFGGGFYDRLLASLPQRVARVGVAFDEQLADDLPRGSHDQPVDVIVTPSKIVRVPGRGSGGADER